MSVTLRSRLVRVFWVIHAVATVAEPPTSDPSTPDIAVKIVTSMTVPFRARASLTSRTHAAATESSGRRPLCPQLGEDFRQPFDDVCFDLGRLHLAQRLDGSLPLREMHHQHVAQFRECHRVIRSAHRGVVVQDTLDDPRLEDLHVAYERQSGNLVIELVEILRPPRDKKIIRLVSHRSPVLASTCDGSDVRSVTRVDAFFRRCDSCP